MSLLTRIQAARDCHNQHRLITLQRALLDVRADEIERWKKAALEQVRASREIAAATLLIIDNPGADVREDIVRLVRDLSDQVARLEEHV